MAGRPRGRPRDPNRDKAFKIYKRHNGKISNKEIAEILGEDSKKISKWKALDEWNLKLEEKLNSKNSKNESTYDYVFGTEDIEVEKEINTIEEVDELNEKQVLFCVYYVKCFNATKAYQRAYNSNKTTAMVNGCKLLSKTNIQLTINKLKQGRINRAMLSQDDIFQKYMDIAFADMSEYITISKENVRIGTDNEGRAIYQKVDSIQYAASEDFDGTIVREFKQGKDGISIKLEDRMKALQWLSDHMDIATEEQKARVESLRSKVKMNEESMELAKKKFEREDF